MQQLHTCSTAAGGAARCSSLAFHVSRPHHLKASSNRRTVQAAAAAAGADGPLQQTGASAASLAAEAAAAAHNTAARQLQQQRTAHSISAAPQPRSTAAKGSSTSALPVFVGAAALAVGVIALAYRNFLSGAAKSMANAGLSAVSEGMKAKKIQRDAAARLNELSSLLQNSQHADLSAKNLGDEGTAYVVEALAFNTSCMVADLSNNGIGHVGIAQLCEVLPTSALQHLNLHTNKIGEGALHTHGHMTLRRCTGYTLTCVLTCVGTIAVILWGSNGGLAAVACTTALGLAANLLMQNERVHFAIQFCQWAHPQLTDHPLLSSSWSF